MNRATQVQARILNSAKEEFLLYGYKEASLRRIAKAVGLTTGAIYTYFKGKQALFDAVVAPVTEYVETLFSQMSKSYYTDECVLSPITYEKTIADLMQIYDFIYEYFDLFRILLLGSDGSAHDDFIHVLVNHEVDHTLAYLERLKLEKPQSMLMDVSVIHTISEGYINALLEPIRHNISKEKALNALPFIVSFYTGGWLSVLGKEC